VDPCIEYQRNGTQCLFAASKVHYRDVIAMTLKTGNRQDLIRFLGLLDAGIPTVDGQQIVAITDNLSTRRTREARNRSQRIAAEASRAPRYTPRG
jgi:hypothetical protein